MRIVKESEEVYYPVDKTVKLNNIELLEFKAKAAENRRERVRLCCHDGLSDPIHEMIIVHSKDNYVRPHKHIGKSESFHIIEGKADAIIFDNQGSIKEVIALGQYGSGEVFYVRLPEGSYHSFLIKSSTIIFHETTAGPFDPQKTIFAPWSPEEKDEKQVSVFLEELRSRLRLFGNNSLR